MTHILTLLALGGIYLTTVYLIYLLVMWWTARWLRLYRRELSPKIHELLTQETTWPEITIVVPACNEEESIERTIQSLQALEYPHYKVFIVNDGSRDRTLEILKNKYQLKNIQLRARGIYSPSAVRQLYQSESYKNLYVLDKPNTGKADSINCGLNFVETKLFAICDADVELDSHALEKLAEPFVRDTQYEVIAVGSPIRARSENSMLTEIQSLEYLRAFVGSRMNWNRWNDVFMISGALGLYSTEAALASSGIPVASQTEDLDFTFRLQIYHRRHNKKFKIIMIPEAVCSSSVPTHWKTLLRQRFRWHRGLLETLWLHKYLFFNPKYGRLGCMTYPYLFFVELISPFIEWAVISLLGVGVVFKVVGLRHVLMVYVLSIIFNILSDSMLMSYAKKFFPSWTKEFKGVRVIKVFFYEGVFYHFVLSFVRFLSLAPFALKGDPSWRARHTLRSVLFLFLLQGLSVPYSRAAKTLQFDQTFQNVHAPAQTLQPAQTEAGVDTRISYRFADLDFYEYQISLERLSRFQIADFSLEGEWIKKTIKREWFSVGLSFSPQAKLLPQVSGWAGLGAPLVKQDVLTVEANFVFKGASYASDRVLMLTPGFDFYYSNWLSSLRFFLTHMVQPNWTKPGVLLKQSYYYSDLSKISLYASTHGEAFYSSLLKDYQATPVYSVGAEWDHEFKANWGLGFGVDYSRYAKVYFSQWLSVVTRLRFRF